MPTLILFTLPHDRLIFAMPKRSLGGVRDGLHWRVREWDLAVDSPRHTQRASMLRESPISEIIETDNALHVRS